MLSVFVIINCKLNTLNASTSCTHRKNGFAEVSKNLAGYK